MNSIFVWNVRRATPTFTSSAVSLSVLFAFTETLTFWVRVVEVREKRRGIV